MERPDEVLVEASRRGEHDSYAVLMRRHLRRVFAICLGLLGELADAEDVAQETFVRGYQKLPDLRDGTRFASWIDQIARNRCRDLLRKHQRRPEQPLTNVVENAAAPDAEDFGDLRAALARLPEEHRVPLLLYYYDGKDTQTLAREMGLSQGGACSRLFRARRQLRRLLDEEVTYHG